MAGQMVCLQTTGQWDMAGQLGTLIDLTGQLGGQQGTGQLHS